MNDNNKFTDNNEIIFWKVINNKYLFKLIFHHIKTSEYHINIDKGFNFKKEYDKYFEKRISFKNITKFSWFIEKKQFQLLLCKLYNKEYIYIDNGSIKKFISYFEYDINNNNQMDLSTTFKEILLLLIKNKVIGEPHYLKLFCGTQSTLELFKSIIGTDDILLSNQFKNQFVYNGFYKFRSNLLYILENFKSFYNLPLPPTKTQTTQSKQLEISHPNKRFKQLNGDYSFVNFGTDEKEEEVNDYNNSVKPIIYSSLTFSGTIELQIRLIVMGFCNFFHKSESDKEKIKMFVTNINIILANGHNNNTSSDEIEKQIFKELSIRDGIWTYFQYLKKYDQVISELDSCLVLKFSIKLYSVNLFQWCLKNEVYSIGKEISDWNPQIDLKLNIDFIDLYINQDKIISNTLDLSISKSIKSKQDYDMVMQSSLNWPKRILDLIEINWETINKPLPTLPSQPQIKSISTFISPQPPSNLLLFINDIIGSLSIDTIESYLSVKENNPIYFNSLEIIKSINEESNKYIKNVDIFHRFSYYDNIPYGHRDEKYPEPNSSFIQLESIVKMIDIFVQFYNDNINTTDINILVAIESIIQYLFIKFISFSNVSIERVNTIYKFITCSNVNLNHSTFHSSYYLSKKSKDLIIYIFKLLYFGKNINNYNINDYIDPSIFTFDFIFSSSNEQLLNILMFQNTLSPTIINERITNNQDYYSNVSLNFNLEFLLSCRKIEMFLNLLNLIQQQLQDKTIEIGSFPNKIENYRKYQNNLYKIAMKNELISFYMEIFGRRGDYESNCGGSAYDLGDIYHDLQEKSTSTILGNVYSLQKRQWRFSYSTKVIHQLFDKPFYRFKKNNINHDDQNLEMEFNFDKLIEKLNLVYVNGFQDDIFGNCVDFDCNCNTKETIVGSRLFYFSNHVYYKAIEVLSNEDFKEFIKFCDYHSFIQFLYSYNVNVKYLLKYFELINHILINHNSIIDIGHGGDDHFIKLKFIYNYWDSVFTASRLKQKTIFDFEKLISTSVTSKNSFILVQLIENYKLNYPFDFYHIQYQHDYDEFSKATVEEIYGRW